MNLLGQGSLLSDYKSLIDEDVYKDMQKKIMQQYNNPITQGPSMTSQGAVQMRKLAYDPKFSVRKIRNGFILTHAKNAGARYEEDHCADLAEVGQRVTAILVQHELEWNGEE